VPAQGNRDDALAGRAGNVADGTPASGLFAAGDAWLRTGDLFYRDEDGDFWLAGSADSLVTTAHGVVGGSAVEDALGILDAIDMSVTYAAPEPTATTSRPPRHAAVRPIARREDLSAALGQLPPDRRPHVVHVVERIPTSTSHRPLPSAFAAAGRPAPGPGFISWIGSPASTGQ